MMMCHRWIAVCRARFSDVVPYRIIAVVLLLATSVNAQVDEASSRRIFFTIEGHDVELPYYRNHALSNHHATATRAVINIHGLDRNAVHYHNSLQEVAHAVAMHESMILITPQFLTEVDIAAHHVSERVPFWSLDGWPVGHRSHNTAEHPRPVRPSSFTLVDKIVRILLNDERYPRLQTIVVVGFSAGGQFVNRYAAGNRMHDVAAADGVAVRYVVASPSSYVYLDDQRALPGSHHVFGTPDAAWPEGLCEFYNAYRYGLEELNHYLQTTGVEQIREQFAKRDVVMLLGEADTHCEADLALSCAARLQGGQRFERGVTYMNYLLTYYDAGQDLPHRAYTLPKVGHSGHDHYRSDAGKHAIFDVLLPASSILPRLITPTMPIGTSLPTFVFHAVANATQYEVEIRDSHGNTYGRWYMARDLGCSWGGLCRVPAWQPLPPGQTVWRVRAQGAFGEGPWSLFEAFEVSGDPPGTLHITAPNGVVDGTGVEFRWQAAEAATSYGMIVEDMTGEVINRVLTSADVCACADTCLWQADMALASGLATVRMTPQNDNGMGTSVALDFIVD